MQRLFHASPGGNPRYDDDGSGPGRYREKGGFGSSMVVDGRVLFLRLRGRSFPADEVASTKHKVCLEDRECAGV